MLVYRSTRKFAEVGSLGETRMLMASLTDCFIRKALGGSG
ncbi:hypothetical protein MMEU_1662 [Mycobacterium marinum str. Europe]|nr:hypothetical protein MMEU_1662 [Mycobacterium marinum str. Europe]